MQAHSTVCEEYIIGRSGEAPQRHQKPCLSDRQNIVARSIAIGYMFEIITS